MKKIKKQTCNVYRFVNHSGEYKKKLFRRGYTIYDRKVRVLKRVDFDYTDVRHMAVDPMDPVCLIPKRYLKKPRRREHVYKYEGDRLTEELFYGTSRHLSQRKYYEYDDRGNMVYCKYCWIGGEIIYEIWCEYDEDNRKIREDCKNYDLKDNSVSHYYYDKNGRVYLLKDKSDLAGEMCHHRKYDHQGNIIAERHFSKGYEYDSKTVYIYNEVGQKIRTEFYDDKGILTDYLVHEYDSKSHCIFLKKFSEVLKELTESTYNKYGHMISSIYTNYYCDCRGVRVVPYQMDVLEYEYY